MITYNLYLGDDVMKVYLKEVRKQKKMTLMQLEDLSGVSNSEIRDIENGIKTPRISTLYVLAKALQIPITALFSCD